MAASNYEYDDGTAWRALKTLDVNGETWLAYTNALGKRVIIQTFANGQAAADWLAAPQQRVRLSKGRNVRPIAKPERVVAPKEYDYEAELTGWHMKTFGG